MRRRVFLALACAAARTRAASSDLGAIAYVQADGLWVRSLPDGAPKKLLGTAAERPQFSPSGEWIVYNGGVIRAAGGAAYKLPNRAAVWLPKRDALAIETDTGVALFDARNNWSAPSLVRKGAGLGVFSPDGSVSRYLMGSAPYAWTRDSRYILYWEDPDFSASVQADGLELFRIPAGGGKAESLGVSTLVRQDLLSLAPIGNQLAVTAGKGRETWTEKRIAAVDLDTLALHYLTGSEMAAVAPAWSPDGKQIAYSAAKSVGHIGGAPAKAALDQRRIWTVSASGPAVPRQLTSDPRYRDEEPLWSADGASLLFCRMDSAGAGALWLMGSAGEHPVRVSGALDLKRLPSGEAWFGFYGYIDWRRTFDWHRPAG
jgi:dipeptidyl aminopeptidase/acylaminoacyl peptidase